MWLCSSKHTHIYVDTHTYNPYIYIYEINYYMLLGGTLAKSYMCVCERDSEHMNIGTYIWSMNIYKCVCVNVCVCMYRYICTHTHTHTHIYIYKQTYIPIPMMMIYAFIHNSITNSFVKAIMGLNCLAFLILNSFSV